MTKIDLEDILSSLYHSLRAPRRRRVIQCLREADSKILATRELARKIAEIENNIPEHQATGEPYRNAYNALTQTHLPTLDDAGVIIYDHKRQIASPGPNFELAGLLLDTDTPTVDVFVSLVGLDSHDNDR